MSFHTAHPPGELIERIDDDVTALANFFSRFAIRVLGNALLVLGILAILFRATWWLGLALAIYVVLISLVLRAVQGTATGLFAAARQARADQYSYIEERIGAAEDIRTNGAEAHVLGRFFPIADRTLLAERRARLIGNITFFASKGLAAAGYALGLGLGAYLCRQGQISLGTAYSIVFYIGMLATPLEAIRTQVQDLQQAGAALDRVAWLFAQGAGASDGAQNPGATRIEPVVRSLHASIPASYPRTHGSAAPVVPQPARGEQQPRIGRTRASAIAFRHVHFAYDGTREILHDVDIALRPGEVLGLVGRTGSGKSTLGRLLFRLYDPTAGSIILGDRDLRDISEGEVRSRIGMVTQEVQLFGASVRDNLTLFRDGIAEAEILAVLGDLGLGAWFRALPDGLDTAIAPGGRDLSGGEAQLLAFARVFLRDPQVVVLDEASSRLDPATERLVEHAVDRLLAGHTAIVIAHRLHTVLRADRIAVLEGGRVVEQGQRVALAADPASRFAGLLRGGLEVPA